MTPKRGDIIQRLDESNMLTIGVVRDIEGDFVRADFVSYYQSGRISILLTDHPAPMHECVVLEPVLVRGESEAERPRDAASPGSPSPETDEIRFGSPRGVRS